MDELVDNPSNAGPAVTEHIAACPACAREVEARRLMRRRVRDAAKSEPVPPELRALVNERIRHARTASTPWFRWRPLAAGTVFAMLLAAGVTYRFVQRMAEENAEFARLSASLPVMLRVGFGDHLHCSVFHKSHEKPVALEKAAAKLDEPFRPVAKIVADRLPSTLQVFLAHHCRHRGRQFVHISAREGERMLSVVLVRKEDREALGSEFLDGAAGAYHTSAFESRDYLGYVVSDLEATVNLQLARRLAPAVREFLDRT